MGKRWTKNDWVNLYEGYLEGLSISELAQKLNKPLGTVQVYNGLMLNTNKVVFLKDKHGGDVKDVLVKAKYKRQEAKKQPTVLVGDKGAREDHFGKINKKHKKWSPAEYHYLYKHHDQKELSDIADDLGRTTKSVKVTLYRMIRSNYLTFIKEDGRITRVEKEKWRNLEWKFWGPIVIGDNGLTLSDFKEGKGLKRSIGYYFEYPSDNPVQVNTISNYLGGIIGVRPPISLVSCVLDELLDDSFIVNHRNYNRVGYHLQLKQSHAEAVK